MDSKNFIGLGRVIGEDYPNTAGIIVRQNGETMYENYFNGLGADDAVHIASVTKSVFSALIGIAIEDGYIKSVNQSISDFFPEYPPGAFTSASGIGNEARPESPVNDVTLKNLLTMTALYKFEAEPFEEFFTSENWLAFALDCLGGAPAGEFYYSPIVGTHILSGILARATGKPILDYAAEKLFAPLGIRLENITFNSAEEQMAWYSSVKKSGGWVADAQGINTAGWGLTLTTADMAKIGQLYLNGGVWEGKRLIPEKWAAESTAEHVRWGELSYGYLWWVIDNKKKIYAAIGDGGNVIYVNTAKKLVVAMASLFTPNAKDRIEFITEHIEPLV